MKFYSLNRKSFTTSPLLVLGLAAGFMSSSLGSVEGVGVDESIYFSTQEAFENEAFPFAIKAGTVPSFTETDDVDAPFSKVAVSSSLTEFASDFIPVQAGETLYGEIWAKRELGSVGASGKIYYGISRFDKDKKYISQNAGLDYFVVSQTHVPQDGEWKRYSGEVTLPESHNPYSGSDGGAVRYVKVYVIVNYSQGTIPTYWGGVLLRRVTAFRDAGDVAFHGNVGIGIDDPGHELDVVGTIRAHEVIVEAGTADYVFEDGYKLRTLDEVEAHIAQHGHLPGVPSAADVARAGVSVGDSQRILLEKVEELTLYAIQQERRLESQREVMLKKDNRINDLESRMGRFEALLSR